MTNYQPVRAERRLTVLRARSMAKVTLSLRVLGLRADGYHDLDALTVAADRPFDDVVLTPQYRGIRVSVSPNGAAPTTPDNLASRAIRLLRPHLPADLPGIRIRLVKQIPMGGGLGGGSGNAAAVLTLLARHYRVPKRIVEATAKRLGSDVPFALRGIPAFMRGRGDRLDRADHVPALHLVIATPPFGCSTPDVYRAWDALGGPKGHRVVESDLIDGGLRNDLEPAALVVAPELAAFRDTFAAATEGVPVLCGSGSSYAVIAADAEAAAHFARRAADALAVHTVWAAATTSSRAR
jgi:4-diphosphocytidyl-2-C-methyl-D-erythritol kinase